MDVVVREASLLLRMGVPIYDFQMGLPPPLVNILGESFRSYGLENLFPVILDLSVAFYLYQIAKHKFPSSEEKLPLIISSIFLFNPFTLLSSCAKSISSLSHLVVLGSFYHALVGNQSISMIMCGCATYISLYPITSLIPLLAILPSEKLPRHILSFTGTLICLLLTSRVLVGSWSFLISSYLSRLSFDSLKPNVGLYWYLFIEMFDFFRPLFISFLQIHTFFYGFPLAIRFRDDPYFMNFLVIALQGLFNPYPTVSDAALYLSMMPLFPDIIKKLRFLIPSILTIVVAFILAPINWYYWIHQGSGNANFYYANTLIYNVAQVIIIVDILRTYIWNRVINENPGIATSELYQK